MLRALLLASGSRMRPTSSLRVLNRYIELHRTSALRRGFCSLCGVFLLRTPLTSQAEGPRGSLSCISMLLIAGSRRATHAKRAARTLAEAELMLARAAFTCQCRRCASSWTPVPNKNSKRAQQMPASWLQWSPSSISPASPWIKWVPGRCRRLRSEAAESRSSGYPLNCCTRLEASIAPARHTERRQP